MVKLFYKRTKGPLATTKPLGEGRERGLANGKAEVLQTLAFRGKCATFFTAHFPQFRWFGGIRWFGAAALCFGLAGAGESGAPAHPLYISVTEITHNSKDKILEISCKMFTNDLETVLEKVSGLRVDLSAASGKAASDKLIEAYVEKHLRLRVDGKVVGLHFVGSEKENDGTWSYFQVNDIPAVKKIEAVDDLLYDGFNQQINILHVTVGGLRKSTRLDYPDASAAFEF